MVRSQAVRSSDTSAARKQLDSDGAALVKDGVPPHDLTVEQLVAPLPALRAQIEPEKEAFAKRGTGLAEFDAAAEIAAELRADTLGLPADLRVLRKRPASVLALLQTASLLLGSLHQLVRRQARGKTKRQLAERFAPRSGNSTAELIADGNAFLKATSDPTVQAAFRIQQADLDDLRGVVGKLSAVAEAEATRSGVTDAQLAAIDLKQLSLEAFYALLAGNAGVLLREQPSLKQQLLSLIPRSPVGRAKGEEETEPTTTTTAAPVEPAKAP